MKRPQRFDRQRRKPQRGAEPVRMADPVHLVNIEKPIYGGAFLARDEGKAIFVPLALPGEQARVRLIEQKRGYAAAEIDERLTTAPERVIPKCKHFGSCGGCHYQHASYEAQVEMKRAVLRETLERGGVHAPEQIAVLAGQPWEYRNRIRVAFDSQGRPGYRGRRSHAIVPMEECPIAAPLLVRAALAVAETLRSKVPAFRPTEMALFANAGQTAMLMTIIVTSPAKVRLENLAHAVQERIPELSGAELALEARGNEPPRTLAQWGSPSLLYSAAGAEYRVDHGAFFQVNRWLVDALVERVTAGYSGELAWDLFAGVGLFACKLAQSFAHVTAVESAPSATDALAANLAANLDATGAEAVRTSTLEFLQRRSKNAQPDLIIVDPPRTGLGPDVTTLLGQVAAPSLVYVSCDPATLARDLKALLASGYSVDSVTLADLFPQTFHLETVARLRRT